MGLGSVARSVDALRALQNRQKIAKVTKRNPPTASTTEKKEKKKKKKKTRRRSRRYHLQLLVVSKRFRSKFSISTFSFAPSCF